MTPYHNIKSGFDFVEAFKDVQETVDFLERKSKRLKRERDSLKKSLEAVKERYHIVSLKYSALKPEPACGCCVIPW